MRHLKILLLFLCAVTCRAQLIKFKPYVDPQRRFKIDIPSHWTIKPDTTYGYICVPTTAKEKVEYQECFEGVIFSIQFYNTGLDSTLLAGGMYKKDGDTWYT